MPLIQIELSEIESLKNEINELKASNENLFKRIEELNEKTLIQESIFFGKRLASEYIKLVFQKAGFVDTETDHIEWPENADHWYGQDWYKTKKEELNVKISALVYESVKIAFMKLWISNK